MRHGARLYINPDLVQAKSGTEPTVQVYGIRRDAHVLPVGMPIATASSRPAPFSFRSFLGGNVLQGLSFPTIGTTYVVIGPSSYGLSNSNKFNPQGGQFLDPSSADAPSPLPVPYGTRCIVDEIAFLAFDPMGVPWSIAMPFIFGPGSTGNEKVTWRVMVDGKPRIVSNIPDLIGAWSRIEGRPLLELDAGQVLVGDITINADPGLYLTYGLLGMCIKGRYVPWDPSSGDLSAPPANQRGALTLNSSSGG